ncbi:META domain-containing protein [Sphingomonas sp. BGYR3]|uniref:META domain-containing protein n=1 Tax=Sphingomonas sp. BGYR3 TaxID=2975483 RepID=UPI0021A96E85|nr:META domain-containing protein [Sphingomonas sp. BGYR3]MDG5488140.1 META domain-containing protein [Sphingomonas sp. BGYR3]
MRLSHLIPVAALMLAACQPMPNAPGPPGKENEMSQPPLGNTRWQLVEFQSPNDRIGTISPAAPDRYKLDFQADGRLAMQLDCNRGMGQWRADGATLTMTSGATTRAMCPPGTWDMLIARDLGKVASYVVRDGDLYLALTDDGGIYRWRRLP